MVVVVVITPNFNDPLEDNLLGAIDTGENGDVVRIKCGWHFMENIWVLQMVQYLSGSSQLRVDHVPNFATAVRAAGIACYDDPQRTNFELRWPLR